MYKKKKKLQNEATSLFHLHFSWFIFCLRNPNQTPVERLPSPPLDMPASRLCSMLSAVAFCIATAKLSVSVWRQCHEYTCNSTSISETKLWLQTAMCAVLFMFNGLLLVFSFLRPEEKDLQIVLSLTGVSSVIYLVNYLTFITNCCTNLNLRRVDICHCTVRVRCPVRRVGFGGLRWLFWFSIASQQLCLAVASQYLCLPHK